MLAPRSAAPTLAQKPTPRPTDNGDVIVYATKTGKKYHREGCSSLSKSKIPMKLRDAVAAGLGPCKNCKPPVLQK